MFIMYLKLAWRNIIKQKGYSFINIAGLAVGITAFFTLMLFVRFETGYDDYHPDADQIYLVSNVDTMDQTHRVTSGLLAQTLKEKYPEVMYSARRYSSLQNGTLKVMDRLVKEDVLYYVDPDLFHILAVDFISGNPDHALSAPYSMVISESLQKKLFGGESAQGKQLLYNNKTPMTITGVFKDIPANTHFRFSMLASLATVEAEKLTDFNWNSNSFFTYVKLRPGHDPVRFSRDIQSIVKTHYPADQAVELCPTPIGELNLSRATRDFSGQSNDMTTIWLLSAIGLALLLMACFNYMNMTTARSANRSREIGVRKAVGAAKSDLIRQFLAESFLTTLMAVLLASGSTRLLLPPFNRLVGRDIPYGLLLDGGLILGGIAVYILVSLLAGTYPAFFLSSFPTLQILKGKFTMKSGGSAMARKTMVVLQFSISLVIMVCTLVIYRQMQYIQTKPLGFEKDHVLAIPLTDEGSISARTRFKTELLKNPSILGVSFSWWYPYRIPANTEMDWRGRSSSQKAMIHRNYTDADFIDLYDLRLVGGRNFTPRPNDGQDQFIINETALHTMGWADAVGKTIRIDDQEGVVVGVVKDFHFAKLHEEIQPLALIYSSSPVNMSVKIRSENISRTIDHIRELMHSISPDSAFDYSFIDERIGRLYAAEQKLGQIFSLFTLITVFISCMGLMGLAAFAAAQRKKEIGIRKTLGASVSNVFFLIIGEFFVLVSLSAAIAFPLAFHAIGRWLDGFAYRIDLGPGVFLSVAFFMAMLVLSSVSYQALKAAWVRPQESLKYE